jgi:chemotaxis protein CheC
VISLPTGVDLDELEHDALTELVNISVSRAAVTLRQMVGEQVHLAVPAIALVSRAQAIELLGAREASKLVAVHQVFDGSIKGRALLIFPEAKSLELVRAVAGGELPLEDIIDLEQEALAETGNIILNNCLGTVSNLLQQSLKISLPEVLRGDATELLSLAPPPEAPEKVLFLSINFMLKGRDISGYIAMLMDVPSLVVLKQLIGEFIERLAGGEAVQPHV